MAGSKTAPPEKCAECQRTKDHGEGCARVVCPCRRPVTAQVSSYRASMGSGCFKTIPNFKEK